MDFTSDNTHLTIFSKRVRELKPANDNPRFTNALAIQVEIKYGKNTEAYTEKLAKAMEYVNEHGNHPVLSQCVFVPFGRGAAIDQDTFCSLIRMQNEFLHNIKHVEIRGLSDIDIELHLGINDEDGEDYANSIREILLEECDVDGQRIFHSIERTMKADTSRALFYTHNEQYSLISITGSNLSSRMPTTILPFVNLSQSEFTIPRSTNARAKPRSNTMHMHL
jgi:hypothetical protein